MSLCVVEEVALSLPVKVVLNARCEGKGTDRDAKVIKVRISKLIDGKGRGT